MGGGHHHVHVVGNQNNMQETDQEMLGKIQRIDTIKHNPNHFHLEFFDVNNMFNILGGAQALAFGVIGGGFSYWYYAQQVRPYNYYANNLRVASRLFMGVAVGLAFGYHKFGDRQALHNAWVAERLRRRHPESMQLHEKDLWRLKGVKAPHEFYRWQ